MKILVIGDSLAFSRSHKGQRLEDAWPSLLQFSIPGAWVWQRAEQGATSSDARRELQMLRGYMGGERPFSFIIVQVGIVDCCPRPLPRLFTWILQRMPLGGAVTRFLNAHHRTLLAIRAQPWVKPALFRKNLRELISFGLELAPHVILIRIAPPCHYLLENARGVTEQVACYNAIIDGLGGEMPTDVRVVDPYTDHPDPLCLLLPDGHHLTHQGHCAVLEALLPVLVPRNQ